MRSRDYLPFLAIGLFFLLALRPIEAFDTFWQLQSGKYIWQTKSFIYTDLFSIAAEVSRIEHCWLSDLIFYGLYTLGGYGLLGLLKPLLVTLCAVLLWRWNRQRGVDSGIVLPVLGLCLLASEPSWLVRPQLWTFVLSLLYLHLLFVGREQGLRAWLWLVPLMALWANLHAACVFGFVLVGLFWLGELIRFLRKEASRASLIQLAAVGLLVVAAAFINPYGYKIPMILFGNINLHDIDNPGQLLNMEWLPPTFAQVPLFYVVMLLWGVVILLRLRRLDPVEAVFYLAFLYMGLSMIRHTTLVALLAGYFLPVGVAAVFPALAQPKLGPWLRWGTMAALAGMLVLRSYQGFIGVGLKESEYPIAATEFLLLEQLPAPLYNSYDWGGYLMWRLYPDYLVFVDGRSNSLDTFNASSAVDSRRPEWSQLLDDYKINTVMTRTCFYDTGAPLNLIDGLTRHPGWALIYGDDTALLFVRRVESLREYWEGRELPATRAYATMRAEAARLLAEDGSRTRVHLALGRAALNLGELPEALHHYRRHLASDPQNREAQNAVKLLPGRIAR